ncbi:DUF3352 domain-containing protein [Labilibacter marinus]|uniref:DUF3352 domain-containing protein n=1 Tax=Labilibacter marinus TaxID=1477105 RepID=UPI00083311CE|nr:DUF3352 domain-containing protein [Labilibacter marinus]
MKQIFKFLGILILAVILVAIGVISYFHFGGNANRSPISLIGDDAIIIAETDNLSELMVEFTQSDYWNSILASEMFSEFKEGMVSFNSTVEENKWIPAVLTNQKVAISMHPLSTFKSDFLMVMDVKKYGSLNLVPKIANALEWPIQRNEVDSIGLYSVAMEDADLTVHLATIDNLLIGSLSYQLVEKTIKNRNAHKLQNSIKNNTIVSVYEKRQLNVYVDINKVFEVFKKDASKSFFNGIDFSILGGDFYQSSFVLDGFSSYNDSISSLFNPLMKSTPGERKADKVLPSGVVFYSNFNVSNTVDFYEDFLSQYESIDPEGYESYLSGIKLTESYLGINLKEDLFSWMDGEIALAKLRPSNNARELDFVLAMSTNDIDLAEEKLSNISKKIKNRTAVRFKQQHYKNHEINFLNVSGFFKLFLGDFFQNKEKPYYTVVNNFVLFSNSSDRLMEVIDSYFVGNTLERNTSFAKFNEELKEESSVTAYVNMLRLYEHLYYYSNRKDRADIKPYKELMEKVGLVGLQMFPENGFLRTQLIAKQDTSEKLNIELEQMNVSAEELIIDEFDSLQFKIDLGEEYVEYDGDLSYYLTHPERVQDSVLVHEGKLDDGALDGLWKTYFLSGNIESVVPYDDGAVDGTAIFYYDNERHIIRAELEVDDDILDGEYKEFYTDGNIKARLYFKDHKRWGDAFFYYKNGAVKIKGQFKRGERSGNWKYYSKTGELLKKENW